MTTIAALHVPGQGTWIGSDQQISIGPMRAGPVQKWVVHPSGWAAGAAGYYATIQIMQQQSDTLFRNLKSPIQFGDRLRKALHTGGFMPGNEEPGPMFWGNLAVLLASPDGLWGFDATLGFHQIPDGQIWAEGSGKEYAFGAGHALLNTNTPTDPAEIVHAAIAAGICYDNTSGFDPWVAHIARKTPVKAPVRTTRKR